MRSSPSTRLRLTNDVRSETTVQKHARNRSCGIDTSHATEAAASTSRTQPKLRHRHTQHLLSRRPTCIQMACARQVSVTTRSRGYGVQMSHAIALAACTYKTHATLQHMMLMPSLRSRLPLCPPSGAEGPQAHPRHPLGWFCASL